MATHCYARNDVTARALLQQIRLRRRCGALASALVTHWLLYATRASLLGQDTPREYRRERHNVVMAMPLLAGWRCCAGSVYQYGAKAPRRYRLRSDAVVTYVTRRVEEDTGSAAARRASVWWGHHNQRIGHCLYHHHREGRRILSFGFRYHLQKASLYLFNIGHY